MTNVSPIVLGLDGDIVRFLTGLGPVTLDAHGRGGDSRSVAPVHLSLADPDSVTFEGGSLSVSIVRNGLPGEDVLLLDPTALSLSGSDGRPDAGETITVDGAVIGRIAAGGDGRNGNDLIVTFTADATPSRVETLLGANSEDIGTLNKPSPHPPTSCRRHGLDRVT